MFTDQMLRVLIGLAFIIPAIFVLRWWLTRSSGSPEEWAAGHIAELKRRRDRGEIDESTYQRRLRDLTDD